MYSETAGVDARAGADQGMLQTPVLLLIFNRPRIVQAVLESLRVVRPTTLYIAADGPRHGNADDARLCTEARSAATKVEWDCRIETFFREENAGCGVNVSTAITWFFEHVEDGIILEDDCVPSASFYRYCQELLQYYRDNPKIMHIAGNSHQYGRRRGTASYYFSRYANVWGWATWRRGWHQYNSELRPSWQLPDAWSASWQLSIEAAKGIAVVPNANLVRNIGFGPGATHTKALIADAFLEAQEMRFPLRHPPDITVNGRADIFTYYAHHRLVKHHWLIWWHRLADFLYLKLKPIKRKILGTRAEPPQARVP